MGNWKHVHNENSHSVVIKKVCSAFVAAEDFEKPLPAVLGGTDTNWGQFSSSVIIDGPNEFCGGSLVDQSHVRRFLFLTERKFNYFFHPQGPHRSQLLAKRELWNHQSHVVQRHCRRYFLLAALVPPSWAKRFENFHSSRLQRFYRWKRRGRVAGKWAEKVFLLPQLKSFLLV